ncbi:response regulator [Caulobacter sp. NIBR2454]|uniref:response regulator n=1 Tax=Caulobacter sp. NIBR2454 TaxID=3015996 RepID=UPI0022B703F5|nr:response regulator [Caulobacter sp. NIBR2454]
MSKVPPKGVTPEQLATLSHEFRTPLNGVLGVARLLEGTRLTAEQRSYVTALRDSGDHLLSLVNDLLDFARLGEGRVELHPAPVNVETLLRQVCELMSPRADEKGIEIGWAVAPGVGEVMADEGRLRQVLLNFVGNGVKFTEAGGVLLSAEPSDGGRLRFTVSDTGPGVAPAAREKIFQPFVQAETAGHPGGTGLGLAIVRRLADAMEGAAGVEGDEGSGADFWFEAVLPPVGAAAPETALKGVTVAVASPNAIVREAAAQQVAASGGRAVVGDNIESVLRAAPTEAVILIDIALSEGRKAFAPPPDRACVVLLRAEERGRIDRLRADGFLGYLIKPLRRASLADRVLAAKAAFAGAGSSDTTSPSQEDERVAAAAAPGLRVLLAEDNPINALLARALLEREGCRVDRVASGQEALAALAAGAYDLILMDRRMPDLGGVEATKILRARGVRTPVVALTADAFEDDRRECLAAGMDDFLVKPISADAMRGVLARCVSGGWTQEPGRAKFAS